MKIFLTGASGFLGSHTAEALQHGGYSLSALVRPSSQTSLLEKLNANLVLGQLPNCEGLAKNFQDHEVIIHIAAVVKALSQKEFHLQNAISTQNLVKEILKLKKKPKLFIYISTIAVHDPKQSEDFCLAPQHCQPLSHYGSSKLAAEMALEPLKDYMPVIILRPPVLYGERDWELYPLIKSIRHGFAPLWGQGEKQFSMCYVKDVAQAIVDLIKAQKPASDIYCLDDGEVHTWKTIAQRIGAAFKKEPRMIAIPSPLFTVAAGFNQAWAQLSRKPYIFTLNKLREMKQSRWICGHEKLKQSIDWRPQTDLTQGLQNTIYYYQALGKIAL
jgi:nucleoside-diphosphate-sugar epimerase